MARPFLKWVGGKSRYADALGRCAPPAWARLVEPFMGSAAMFFQVAPAAGLLADLNEELVICFQQLALTPEQIMARLDAMPNTKEFYLTVRAQDPAELDPVARATRVMYLNRTCFRGLWRVNQRGQFNVPYGAYDRPLYNREAVLEASALLAHADVRHAGFRDTMRDARRGDWVFLDPPYVPAGGHADFKRYTAGQFNLPEHEQLAACCRDLTDREIPFLLTNTNNQAARELYAGFRLYALATKRDIALQADRRASSDLVVTNYRLPADAPVIPITAAGELAAAA